MKKFALIQATDYTIRRDYNTNFDRLFRKSLEGYWRESGFSVLSLAHLYVLCIEIELSKCKVEYKV